MDQFEAAEAGALAAADDVAGKVLKPLVLDAAGVATAGADIAADPWLLPAGAVLPDMGNNGTINKATMLMILMSGFTAGPAVSL